jgi:hypothetical protein
MKVTEATTCGSGICRFCVRHLLYLLKKNHARIGADAPALVLGLMTSAAHKHRHSAALQTPSYAFRRYISVELHTALASIHSKVHTHCQNARLLRKVLSLETAQRPDAADLY